MKQTQNVDELQAIARTTRRQIIEMITAAKSGHPGGSLSAVEILVTLYFDVLKHDPANPKWPERDRVILSKGHGCPVLYSVMAQTGYTPVEELRNLRRLGSIYQGHPDVRFIPALEASTGSLGQGLSVGIGMGLAARLDKSPSRTYVIFGDGEVQEGQVWEAAMFAPVHKLDNVVCIIDYNKIQLDGFTKDILDLEPLVEKWRAFGWHVLDIDGHSIPALQAAFAEAGSYQRQADLHYCPHDQGQGCVVHGEQPQVSRRSAIARGNGTRASGDRINASPNSVRQDEIRIEAWRRHARGIWQSLGRAWP
jgi:transketolase